VEIPEIPIGPKQTRKKVVSPAVRKKTSLYLAEKGIDIQKLSDRQQQCVFEYIKARRAMKVWILVGVISGFVFIVLSHYSYSLFSRFSDEFMPVTTVIELDNGTKKVIELDRELISIYGKLCAIFASVLTVTIYSAVSIFVSVFSSILNVRSIKKILDAFLPVPGNVVSTGAENNIELGNIE